MEGKRKYQRTWKREREREEEKQIEIRLDENLAQAEALHLHRKYMKRAIDFEQAKKSEK
jgi:hypothetical protein